MYSLFHCASTIKFFSLIWPYNDRVINIIKSESSTGLYNSQKTQGLDPHLLKSPRIVTVLSRK